MDFRAKFGELELEDNKIIEEVDQYRYLEVTLTNRRQALYRNSEQDNSKQKNHTLNGALNHTSKQKKGALNGIFWSKNTMKNSKIRIYDSIVKSTLTHGSEIWTMSETDEKKILANEKWIP